MPLKHLQFQFLEGKSARLIVETCAEFSIVLFLLISTQQQYQITAVLLQQDSLVEDLGGSQAQLWGLSCLALCPVSASPEQMLLWFVPAGPGLWAGECWTAEWAAHSVLLFLEIFLPLLCCRSGAETVYCECQIKPHFY